MTKTVTARRLSPTKAAAFARIASLSFVEGLSRAETVANLNVVLGKAPDEKQLAEAQAQWQIGYIANRLPVTAKTGKTPEQRIAYAGNVLLRMAAPPTEGKKANKLRAGQVGRRTAAEHKAVRASVSAWSLVKAELGLSQAKTMAEKNATQAKRAPGGKVSGKAEPNKSAAPNVVDLPKGRKMTAPILVEHITTQLAALRSLADKHAAIMPIEMTDVVTGLATLRNKSVDAKRAFEKRLATADAEKAAAEK